MKPPAATPYLPPPHLGLDLLYVDATLLVVNKPTGLLSVPGRGAGKEDCMVLRVQAEFPDALIVHRLDMGTSGLLVFARGKDMLGRLSTLFARREVFKRYVALIEGHLASETGMVDLPLIKDWENSPLQKVDLAQGKPSLTRYARLEYANGQSRVALEPETGRTHQLRVHMAALGHPILGDDFYGAGHTAAAPRLMLHAEVLAFEHPVDGRSMRFEKAADF